MPNSNNRKKTSLALRLIYVIALIFLCVGLCVLGSFRGTGEAYELKTQGKQDAETPSVVFQLEKNCEETDAAGESVTRYYRLKHIYINVGAAYGETGDAVTLRAEIVSGPNSSATQSGGRRLELTFSNFASDEETEETKSLPDDVFYRWVEMTPTATSDTYANGWYVSTYSYVKLTSRTCNVLINEVVFVGEKLVSNSSTAESTGEVVVIPASVYSATPLVGENPEGAAAKAQTLLDRQYLPSTDSSRFNRFTASEGISMMTIAEMRAGNTYGDGNVYRVEAVYGALGEDILALGTLIFGMSPFGLRFFPMLAAAGALLVGSLLVRRIAKNDRAGLVFAVLFALASATLALGGLGTPLMLGVFFFLLSLDMCHRFYANGMKRADFASAVPLLVSGLAGAFAILIHGAFIIPVAGVALLFGAGIVRQLRARRYHLDVAIAEAEAEEAAEKTEKTVSEAAEEQSDAPAPALSPAKKKVAAVVAEYRSKTSIAAVTFGCALVIGAIVFALLFALPLYYPYIKMYSDPAQPGISIFGLAAKAFAGGFVGVNAAAESSNAFNIFYLLMRTDGAAYSAVFGAFLNPVAILAAVCGIAFLVYHIVCLARAKQWDKAERNLLRRTMIPLFGLVFALIAAAFAENAVLFVLLAWIFLFMAAADAVSDFTAREGSTGKTSRVLAWVGFGLLAALFVLYFVFATGLPVAASVISAIFG